MTLEPGRFIDGWVIGCSSYADDPSLAMANNRVEPFRAKETAPDIAFRISLRKRRSTVSKRRGRR